MGSRKKNLEISKPNSYKIYYRSLVINFFSSTSKKKSKKIMKQNQQDYCKVKILENLGEFNILIIDSVWNIEKRALKRNKE